MAKYANNVLRKNPDRPLECQKWVPYENEAYCHLCSSPKDDLLNCYCCDLDVCLECVEPITATYFFATGSMFVLCTSCCPTEVYRCPENDEKSSNRDANQFYCALCQEWHHGVEPETPSEMIELCDLPGDEPPPICRKAYSLKHTKSFKEKEHPWKKTEKNQVNSDKNKKTTITAEPEQQHAGPLMVLRDTRHPCPGTSGTDRQNKPTIINNRRV